MLWPQLLNLLVALFMSLLVMLYRFMDFHKSCRPMALLPPT